MISPIEKIFGFGGVKNLRSGFKTRNSLDVHRCDSLNVNATPQPFPQVRDPLLAGWAGLYFVEVSTQLMTGRPHSPQNSKNTRCSETRSLSAFEPNLSGCRNARTQAPEASRDETLALWENASSPVEARFGGSKSEQRFS